MLSLSFEPALLKIWVVNCEPKSITESYFHVSGFGIAYLFLDVFYQMLIPIVLSFRESMGL